MFSLKLLWIPRVSCFLINCFFFYYILDKFYYIWVITITNYYYYLLLLILLLNTEVSKTLLFVNICMLFHIRNDISDWLIFLCYCKKVMLFLNTWNFRILEVYILFTCTTIILNCQNMQVIKRKMTYRKQQTLSSSARS